MPKLRPVYLLALVLAAVTAQAKDREIYGRLGASVATVTADDLVSQPTTDFSAFQVMSNNSRVGIRGSEDLDGGLMAIYQVEVGVNLDAQSTATDDAITLRNSFIGLSGGWGRIKLGHHDSPYKLLATKIDPFSDTLGDANAILGREGNASYFNSRFNNSITYKSPESSDFLFMGSYSADRDPKHDNLETLNSNDPNADSGYSVLGLYRGNGFTVGGTYESIDLNEGNNTLTGLRAFGKVYLGDREGPRGGRLGVIYEQLDLKDLGGGSWDPSHNNIYATGVYRTDPWWFGGSLGLAGEVKDPGAGYDASESSATFCALGGERKLSDSTSQWANYTSIDNGQDAHYGIGQVEDNCNHYLPADGQNARAISLGIRHDF